MKLITFAMQAIPMESPLLKFANRVADSVSPSTAHAVGIGSGLTGLALWAEVAKHLTVMAGLLVALMAFLGGGFYATYWAIKALREWRELRATGKRRR
jgi:hypothetical protein